MATDTPTRREILADIAKRNAGKPLPSLFARSKPIDHEDQSYRDAHDFDHEAYAPGHGDR